MVKNRTVLLIAAAAIVIILAATMVMSQNQDAKEVTWDDLLSIDRDAAEVAMSLEQTDTVQIQNVTAFTLMHAGVPQDLLRRYTFDWNMMSENTGLMDGVGKAFTDRADTKDLKRILDNSKPLARAFESGLATEPFFHDGLPQPVFYYTPESDDFSNEDSYTMRYCVYVETEYDTDSDGKRDLLEVYLQIPRAALEGGYKAPVILIASPYEHGADEKKNVEPADGYDMSRIYSQPEARDPVGSKSAWDTAMAAKPSDWHYGEKGLEYECQSYLNYFLVRGYAVAVCSMLGSYGSEGYACTGLDLELLSVKSVIDWFDGDAVGYTSKDSMVTTEAEWCSGSVGMYGLSYLGTVQIGLAAMGIDNLKTIIPSGAISNWYEYSYQKGGVIQADNGDAYMSYLAEYVTTSRDPTIGDCGDYMRKLAYDETVLEGQYSDGTSTFWTDRDYTRMAVDTETSIMLIHGINDYNVRMCELAKTMEMFEGSGVTIKTFLHQGAHQTPQNFFVFMLGDSNGMVTMNEWLSRYLFDQDTGVEDWPNIQVQSNLDGSWSAYDSLDSISETGFGSSYSGTETFFSDIKDDMGFEIELMAADEDMTIVGGEVRLRLMSETEGIPYMPVSVVVYDRYEPGMKAYYNVSDNEVESHMLDTTHPEDTVSWFGSNIPDQILYEYTLKDTTSRQISIGTVGLGYYGETVELESMRVQDRETGTYYDYVIDLIPTVYTLKAGHSVVVYITALHPGLVQTLENVPVHYDVTVDLSSVEVVFGLA